MRTRPTTYAEVVAAFEAYCASMEFDPKDTELRHMFMAGVQYAESVFGIEDDAS